MAMVKMTTQRRKALEKMPFRQNLTRCSRKEWATRLALAAIVGMICLYGVTFSLAQVLVKSDPLLAQRLAPYDGRILAAYATSLAGEGANSKQRTQADRVAKHALRQDPTAVAAVATLGMNADIRGDATSARRYFGYAQKLSRRDLRVQLFMIESSVQRGDIPATLHQSDITLRVFPRLGDLLYPVLASAINDPEIRRGLIKTLSGKPIWGEDFVNFIAAKGVDPRSTAALFLGLARAGFAVPDGARATMVNALIRTGETDAAWAYYTTIHPGSDRRRSRDPRFSANLTTPSQLDWTQIIDGSGVTSNIQNGVFDFSAPSSVGGPLLQQFQLLPPGTYRLTGHSSEIEQTGSIGAYWVLTCLGGRELGRVDVPNSAISNGYFSGKLTVPKGCPVQLLVLVARPSNTVEGLSGQFDKIQLAPEPL